MNRYNLLVIGDAGVGKSTLFSTYVNMERPSHFPAYVHTIGVEFLLHKISKDTQLLVWDTGGQWMFHNIVKSYFRGAYIIALMFDVTCRSSFDHVEEWLAEVNDVLNRKTVVLILLGNKIDLADQRVVSMEEAQRFAFVHGLPYFESSVFHLVSIPNCLDNPLKYAMDRYDDLRTKKPQVPNELSQFRQQYQEVSVALQGESGVGKSAIWYRYFDDVYHHGPTHITSQVMNRIRIFQLDGQRIKLKFWDIASYTRLPSPKYGDPCCHLLVFDVTDMNTFHNIQNRVSLLQASNDRINILLVGSKCDSNRVVEYEDAKEYAGRYGIGYVDVSAHDNVNVTYAVVMATVLAMRNRGMMTRKIKSECQDISVPVLGTM